MAIVVENVPLGVDTRLPKQVEVLLDAGFRVTVVTMRDDANVSFRTRPGLTLLEYPPSREPDGPLGYAVEYTWAFYWAAVRLLGLRLRGRIDVLQLCQPPDIYFPLARLLRWGGTRIVVDQRDLMPELLAARYERAPSSVTWLLHLLERQTQRVADLTVTVNEHLKGRLVAAGADPRTVFVVWNGPVLARTSMTSPDSTLRDPSGSLVVWAGKMGRQDRVEMVVQVADLVVNRWGRRDCRFVLLGDGECLEELRAMTTRLHLDDHVQFTGWVPEETVFRHLASADLGIDTSLQEEVSPVKAMEYMALGLPFAAFDLPETRSLGAGAAQYVEPGDVEALARVVLTLLDDEQARTLMGEVGRRTIVERLAWERQAPVYSAVMAPSPRRTPAPGDTHFTPMGQPWSGEQGSRFSPQSGRSHGRSRISARTRRT